MHEVLEVDFGWDFPPCHPHHHTCPFTMTSMHSHIP